MGRIGGWILKYRWGWLALIVGLSVLFLSHIPAIEIEDDETTWYRQGDPTLEAYQDYQDRFEGEDILVVGYGWQAPFSEASLAYLDDLGNRLETEIPYVSDVVSLTSVDDIVGSASALEVRPLIDLESYDPVDAEAARHRVAINPFIGGNLISADESTVSVVLELEIPEASGDEASREIVDSIYAFLDQEEAATGLRFFPGGGRMTENETQRMLENDINRFFPITMVLTAVLLLLFFRRFSSVVLPLITVFLSLGWTLGLKVLVGSPITPVSTTLFALITVIGVANSVHLLSHYNHEREFTDDRRAALLATYRKAGRPCMMTSLTTAVGFASLIVSRVPAIRQLGFFAAFGILTAFVLSMVIVPIGIDWTQRKRRGAASNAWLGRILEGIASFNLKRPGWVLTGSLVIILTMAVGIFYIHPAGSMVEYFRHGSAIRTSIDFLDEHLSGVSSTEVVLYGERDAFKQPANLTRLEAIQSYARGFDDVTAAYSVADTVQLISRALHGDDPAFYGIPETRAEVSQSLLLYEMSGGSGLRDYVSGDYSVARVSIHTWQMGSRAKNDMLAGISTFVSETMPEFRSEITGMDHMVSELNRNVILTQIQSFGLAIGVITIMMILVFGLRAGLLSIVPNALPIVFVLGLMGFAGFGLNIATSIIASIAIGIVVDDTIHYFSHFRDEFRKSRNSRQAMVTALRRVGKALCFTTMILLAGFGVFLFSDSWIMASYGILSGTAIVIALVGDLFLGPVLLTHLPLFRSKKRD